MSISPHSPLCLGSGSPRRRELLSGLGLALRIVIPAVDEDALAGEHPLAYLERVALDKLKAVAAMKEKVEGTTALLVADTIVRVKDEIIGKPRDRDDAFALLQKICGREHIVHTRYAISSRADFTKPVAARTVTSRVWLRAAPSSVLRRYADTGEGLDKAGAYAVQGIGSFLVERIEGSYSNVVGLPVSDVVADLMNAGLLENFP
ncbi:MAG: Maf family protein [Polyangiaceae bacterium]